jgi:uncharacterized protein
LTEKADEHALAVFARNLRNLLLGPPVSGRRVLAVDPGFRSGCKLAVLDQFGSPQEHDVVHIIGSAEQRAAARKRLAELIRKHGVHIIAIGNGTACRESEQVVADMIGEEFADGDVAYVIVNEAGASHYSTSSVAREEFPDYDATLRSAVSIGRRLLDPLSELVKIDPANIGVGMYQHDLKAKHLRDSLSAVVESCVNYVGVDLNTASVDLLRYVSGLNQLTARRIYEYRTANGPFRSREQLLNVPALGEATFVQAAGFLKIAESENPLDVTWIHPESYNVTRAILGKLEASPSDLLSRERAAALKKKSAELNVAQCAAELDVGVHLVRDILSQIGRPGRDPREDLHPPLFKRGILKLEDLTPGMELSGSVLNVVDFGAFVDVGLHDSGLIHVSKLANHFVNDPHAVVAVGDIVKVWVTGVDLQRRRVSLTMIAPGTERPPPGRSARPKRSERSGRQQGTSPPRRRDTRSSAQRSGGPPRERKPRPKPKPLIPLTKAMEDGKEPMRTFGDLAQFFTKKKEIDKPDGDTSK